MSMVDCPRKRAEFSPAFRQLNATGLVKFCFREEIDFRLELEPRNAQLRDEGINSLTSAAQKLHQVRPGVRCKQTERGAALPQPGWHKTFHGKRYDFDSTVMAFLCRTH